MGGVFRKIITKAVGEPLKALKVVPSKKEIEKQMRGQQPVAAPVDSEPINPDEVVYAGEDGQAPKKKKKKKAGGTIMTSTQGVMGDAPTQQKTLLGG